MQKPLFAASSYSEKLSWTQIRANWQQLYGAFEEMGVSFEWHELQPNQPFQWPRTFHPESIEICLNLAGSGSLGSEAGRAEVSEQTGVFYWTGNNQMQAERVAGEKHEFLTIRYARDFVTANFGSEKEGLHPVVVAALKKQAAEVVSSITRLTSTQQELIASLRAPPVHSRAQHTWHKAKALEMAALFFFELPLEQDFFCHRQKFLAQERVEKVRRILRDSLVEPPALDEIARRVGCSAFYLSRTFSKEMGMTIPQFLRQIRMAKAAELLKSGKYNVTEAALEVGYSSLSHFSQAFHDTFGQCPGLYSLFPAKKS